MAKPEVEGWIYEGEKPRDGRSYVCSCFVTSVYKAAGLYDGLDINSTEFGPGDVYEVNFYDKHYEFPEQCKQDDPNPQWCQIAG